MVKFSIYLNRRVFVMFLFLDGDVPRATPNGVYIFQLMRFASSSSQVSDVDNRNHHENMPIICIILTPLNPTFI